MVVTHFIGGNISIKNKMEFNGLVLLATFPSFLFRGKKHIRTTITKLGLLL